MPPSVQEYELLGAFYLGRPYNLKAQKAEDGLILYDSKDLVTHAVCVGMTGSGKTGLCISLLEEAAMDSVPVIAIDPKGDIANLMLTFPDLSANDFAPWVSEDEARRNNLSVREFAQKQAELWKNGLAKWGQDGERIRRLRQTTDFAIYTPGSSAGLGLSILKSFAAPPEAVLSDGELLRERINTTVTSLLGLLGIEADPIRSREHILLSSIIGASWNEGSDLDLAALIAAIQQPPFTRVGVMDLESFYPGKERFELAMQINNLLASPGFNSWMEGEPLDIGNLLYSPSGKPRISIISIAHLGDAERMFIVSLLLNQLVGWMRQQSGTTSLRAILYFDEIFGFLPTTASPPSEKPLLVLLKQARAFGLGLVLATQNPGDLDYKALSNTGTWFIGRLQAEADKARVLEGLEGAAATQGAKFDRQAMEETLAGLGSRIFLMNNVHDDAPVVFETRWAMSYLRGPLTRNQIKQVMEPIKAGTSASTDAAASVAPRAPAVSAAAVSGATGSAGARPMLPPEIVQYFVPARSSQPAGSSLVYCPMVVGATEIHFVDSKAGVNNVQNAVFLAPITTDPIPVNWENAVETNVDPNELEKAPDESAKFGELPALASKLKSYDTWAKGLVDFIYRNRTLDLLKSNYYGRFSNPDESERDFRIRLHQLVREERDAEVEKLRQKYAPKLATLEEKIRRAEQAVEREAEQAQGAKMDAVMSIGSSVLQAGLGALFGRKLFSSSNVSKVTTAARRVGRSRGQSSDVDRAEENVETYTQQLQDLQAEFDAEVEALKSRNDPATEVFDRVQVKPKKKDVTLKLLALAWTPHWQDASDNLTSALE